MKPDNVSSVHDIAAEAIAKAAAAIGASAPPACYSSHALPPGFTSRKAFNAACAAGRVPGAHKRGRVWLVLADDYHRRDFQIIAASLATIIVASLLYVRADRADDLSDVTNEGLARLRHAAGERWRLALAREPSALWGGRADVDRALRELDAIDREIARRAAAKGDR